MDVQAAVGHTCLGGEHPVVAQTSVGCEPGSVEFVQPLGVFTAVGAAVERCLCGAIVEMEDPERIEESCF